ncbi:MAG: CaiB/BaiF CoA transferase family protein [Microthrixaceae bacterium]
MTLPLSGLIVVSFEQAVAAPFATRQLADLGARVIKVERAEGDFARNYDRSVAGHSSYFVWLNRGKESVALDLKSEAGLKAAHALVSRADVVVQNLAPGALGRMGLGAEETRAERPQLIHASLSGYGTGGSYEHRKAYDLLLQCEAGLLSVTGDAEAAKVGISVADICAGMYLYSGILTALLRRGQSGAGATLEVSMLEALGEWMSQPLNYTVGSGTQPARSGPRHATIAPYGPFPTSDGTVFLAVQSNREWALLAEGLLADQALVGDTRFADNPERVAHRAELDETIATVTRRLASDELIARLDQLGIANAQMRDMFEFADHPQLAARDRWRTIGLPGGSSTRALVPPVSMVGVEWAMGDVPALGQHTARVLAELGLAAEDDDSVNT